MVVFVTTMPVPVLVAMVLTMDELFCVALILPPPVALNAVNAPVLRARPPLKAMVAFTPLFVSEMTRLLSVTALGNDTTPPLRLAMKTEFPALAVIGALIAMFPLPPLSERTPDDEPPLDRSTSLVTAFPIWPTLILLPAMANPPPVFPTATPRIRLFSPIVSVVPAERVRVGFVR